MNKDSCASNRKDKKRPMASHVRRAGVFSGVFVAFLMVVAGGVLIWGVGQTVSLPDWLRGRIETRIEQNLGGFQIAFGDVEMVVNRGWRPRVRLRDVTVSEADGRPVLELADAQASLAMRPLLQGKLQPKSISLNGAHVILRMTQEGQLSLALGREESVVREATTIPELIEEWDQRLMQPPLSALVSVEMEALTLRYDDLRQNKSWVLDGGQITLSREGQDLRVASSFTLLNGGAQASSIEMNYSSRIGETEAEIGVSVSEVPAQDFAAQSVALAWLDVLRAPISASMRASVEADGTFGPSSATLQIGAGVLQPNEATKPIPFDGARSYITYSPAEQLFVFDEISVDSAWGSGSADGHAYLDVTDGRFESLIGQLSLNDLTLNPDNLYENPVKVPNALADFRLEMAPFRVSLGQALIILPESQLHLAGQLEAEQDGWTLAIDGSMDSLTPEKLKKLWPERAAPKPRKWVSDNVSGRSSAGCRFRTSHPAGSTPRHLFGLQLRKQRRQIPENPTAHHWGERAGNHD